MSAWLPSLDFLDLSWNTDSPTRGFHDPALDEAAEALRLAGIRVVASPYVPKLERFEADYSRPLLCRLLEGRTVDIRTWEEDQVFIIGDALVMSPEACGVIHNVATP